MTDLHDNILIADSLEETPLRQRQGYVTHALCRRGSCAFKLGVERHSVASGDCLIIPLQSICLSELQESPDLKLEVIYVAATFIENCTPQSNYGMRGHLALFEDPVMHLTPEQQEVCALNFDYIRRRLALPHHHFHRDAMMNAVQCMIIDFFDFHVSLYGNPQVSNQQALLMQHFLAMLDRGDFRQHRQVAHYADELCVTPKYLSEVCHKTSGQSALYWITRYTARELGQLLHNRELTLEEISDFMGFSSVNYLVRYVQKNLGMPPSALRE